MFIGEILSVFLNEMMTFWLYFRLLWDCPTFAKDLKTIDFAPVVRGFATIDVERE